MFIFKDEKLKKKVIEHKCCLCGEAFTKSDLDSNNFEYAKTKFGEVFAHTSCLRSDRE